MPANHTTGRALRFRAAVLATALASAALLGSAANRPPTERFSMECRSTARLFLQELGVGPEALAAVGASGHDAEVIVALAMAMCENPGNSFAHIQTQLQAARAEYLRLEAAVRTGTATREQRLQLAPAREALAEWEESRRDALALLATTVESRLDTEQMAMLRNISAARHVEVPVHFKVVQRSQGEWTALRDRVAEANRVARSGAAATGLTLEQDVQNAKERVDMNLQSVVDRWSAAFTY